MHLYNSVPSHLGCFNSPLCLLHIPPPIHLPYSIIMHLNFPHSDNGAKTILLYNQAKVNYKIYNNENDN